MGNCLRGRRRNTQQVLTKVQKPKVIRSCWYSHEWPCACLNTVGTCSCPLNAAPSPSCVFYSPRILGLLEGHRTEYDTARDHWTVVDSAELETVAEDNRKYFDEALVKHPEWGAFFEKFEDLKVGAKIGERGQAEIFAASSQSFKDPKNFHRNVSLVAKAWKARECQ